MIEPAAAAFERASKVFQTSLLLLVTVGFTTLAVTERLDVFSTSVLAAALLFRGLITFGLLRIRIPRWAASVVAVVYLGYFGYDEFAEGLPSIERLIPASLQMLLFFTALKLLIVSHRRD